MDFLDNFVRPFRILGTAEVKCATIIVTVDYPNIVRKCIHFPARLECRHTEYNGAFLGPK